MALYRNPIQVCFMASIALTTSQGLKDILQHILQALPPRTSKYEDLALVVVLTL